MEIPSRSVPRRRGWTVLEDGTIKTIRDEAWYFQFVRRNGGAADGKTNNNA